MNTKKILCLMVAVLMLTGCSKGGDSSQVSSKAAGSSSKADSSVSDYDSTTTEPETDKPDLVINDSVVEFSQESGFYESGFSLELSANEGDKIYYTTDGTDPHTSATRREYTAPIEIKDRSNDPNVVSAVPTEMISGNFNEFSVGDGDFWCMAKAPADNAVDKCTVIRAASEKSDGSVSKGFSKSFYIGSAEDHIKGLKESCEAAGHDLAVVNITMDYGDLFDNRRGIYVKGDIFDKALEDYKKSGENIEGETARQLDANYKQRGKEWERDCHVELDEISAEGNVTNALSQDCGIRIQGNYSRSDLQKGFRLYARKKYGEKKFDYEVFDGLKNTAGEAIDSYKTLTLRAGGNCAFTAKFNDTYWQSLMTELDCSTKASRPCVVYLNGEYWGLYVLEEDYSDSYFESHYGVNKDDVVVYKGDAETYDSGYKLDEGKLPEGETDEGYFFKELTDFFYSHKDLSSQADYDEFSKLVDTDSVRDYFLAEVWINNKWDWPGKNWSMWKVQNTDSSNEYADGRWRFMFYDVEFGGVSGESDAWTNTMKEDNYKPKGLLDTDTKNPAVLSFAYLMSNEDFRNDFNDRLLKMSDGTFEKDKALEKLAEFESVYSPLYEQFFERYPETGSADEALHGDYASSDCIRAFIEKREKSIQTIVDWTNSQF